MRNSHRVLYAAAGVMFAGSAAAADWSYPLAYRLAIAADCSYEHSTADALKCLNATTQFKTITEAQIILKADLGPEKRDGYLLIHSAKPDLILAIRGTQPPTDQNSTAKSIALDWLNDILLGPLVPPAFEKDGYHAGFLDSWNNIAADLARQPKLTGWIKKAEQHKAFYIAGHSKGGAITLLGTDKICTKDNPAGLPMPKATYAFAPARSLTADKADADKACFNNTWRFELGDDVVTHVPLAASPETDPGKLIEAAYVFRDTVNKIPLFSNIPDYGSVGKLFYVDNKGTGKVIPNQAELYGERVESLAKHLDRLKLKLRKPDTAQTIALVKPILDATVRKTSMQQALKQARNALLQQPLNLDENDRQYCAAKLSLVDDHIVYHQWLSKAVAKSAAGGEVTVSDAEMRTLASCCAAGSAKAVLQCLTKRPDIETIENRE
ncbi:lipase family protein [Methylomonas sp. MgM2]